MKKVIVTIGVVFAVLAFGSICWFAGKALFLPKDIIDTTLTTSNAIANYEWFKQQEADVKKCVEAENIALDAYNEYLKQIEKPYTEFGEKRLASLYDSYVACQQITNKVINDYNAKANMVNRAIFKDNLPTNIDRAMYSLGELITR